ncbi:endonuclease domain-containing protein [Robertkochia marina]|uniref:Endonuclease domain-containing protein n=1 Tax=Robertkochia marina TaxID=1227945 RepID=A0A4S3M2Z0_9FLAO|nr:endonuclease domain-containing protein [Robertkochia marina]THD69049.1 endonuclease domain-containing protein [Robertkochia marina]TRZ44872.1 endonuclease domain-containing protein [Robertkochia marina]
MKIIGVKNRRLHNHNPSRDFRRFLRRRMTPAETYLWGFLKSKKLEGRKFRRQHGIGKYVVDFYCPSERLIVELDGEVHFGDDQVTSYDEKRAAYFERLGIRVLRYENKFVFDYPTWVLEEIKENFNKD